MRIRSLTFLLTCLLLSSAGCGGPTALPDTTAKAGGTTNKKATPCAPGVTGTDSDKDGLTDECEKLLGTDPYKTDSDNDKIDDRHDTPACYPNCDNQDAQEDWKQLLLNEFSNPLTVGGAALTNTAPPGTMISLGTQCMAISDGSVTVGDTTCTPSLCGGGAYIYVKFAGTVSLCSADLTNCDAPSDASIELCAANPPLSGINNANADFTIDDLVWTKARANQTVFDPKIFDEKDGSASATAGLKLRKENSSGNFVTEIESVWTSNWRVSANHSGQQTQIEGSSASFPKGWKRLNASQIVPGYLGLWVNK